MDKSNVTKLARLLKNFTELESSFVLTSEVKAICAHRNDKGEIEGMDVVTPHGTFHDSMDFNTFKTRVGDILEVLKDEMPSPPDLNQKKSGRIVPISPPPPQEGIPIQQPSTIAPPIGTVGEAQPKESTLNLSDSGFTGDLFTDPGLKIVNRGQITIHTMSGEVISTGTPGGNIQGEMISGVIYENGKCRLAAKNFNGGNQVVVKYQVARKG